MSGTASQPPASTGSVKLDAIKQKVEAAAPNKLSGVALYSRFAFAGAVCCSVTHGALTPVDVVKTRIQLDPVTYNRGLIGGFRQAPSFGGYEFFKQQAITVLGYENASNNRTAVYLASSAMAEFFADIALCPLEATRIRLVSDPKFASGLIGGFGKIYSQEGFGAFYSGFGPILFKQ
ncbi:mitochondrial phosphate carrier protein [Friedmanniomyces endolithicus]|nr:mitochondrial phosphate carrier protein [Friedmanniomyces endolithicus]